jgi:hypothetical protein
MGARTDQNYMARVSIEKILDVIVIKHDRSGYVPVISRPWDFLP